MSMLSGMFSPTSGTALINGKDIRHDINGVRSSLGLCPQHNILFEGKKKQATFWFHENFMKCLYN